jgi:hypothetical protein
MHSDVVFSSRLCGNRRAVGAACAQRGRPSLPTFNPPLAAPPLTRAEHSPALSRTIAQRARLGYLTETGGGRPHASHAPRCADVYLDCFSSSMPLSPAAGASEPAHAADLVLYILGFLGMA